MKIRAYIAIAMVYLFCTSTYAGDGITDFKISLDRAHVTEFSGSSFRLESSSPIYRVKMEPGGEGPVMFSLERHAYRSTVLLKNLVFGVDIKGYKDGALVPVQFVIDDSYEDIHIEDHFVAFQYLHHAVPVLFKSSLDSVVLEFSNSHGYNFFQYCTISGMKIMGTDKVDRNPPLIDCDQHSVMIAIEGSGAVDKTERKSISKQLLNYFKSAPSELDSNLVSVVQFDRKVKDLGASTDHKEIASNIKDFKKSKTHKNPTASDWGAAMDEALIRKPDIFVLVTKTWSNYNDSKPSSIHGQHSELVQKCNQLKAQGTRLLFITSNLNEGGDNSMTLWTMLNDDATREVREDQLSTVTDLKHVDLISMDGFQSFELLDFSSLFSCN